MTRQEAAQARGVLIPNRQFVVKSPLLRTGGSAARNGAPWLRDVPHGPLGEPRGPAV